MPESHYYRRRIPPVLRREVFERDGPACRYPGCDRAITLENFHCAHLRSAAHGGPPILSNLQAWCAPCNLKFGNRDALDTRTSLRDWQAAAVPTLAEAISFRRFATLMAAPGAGKTLTAGRVFDWLLHAGLIERMLVVVHRVTLVRQWRDALREQCHIHLDITEGTQGVGRELPGMDGLVTTIQGWQNNETVRRYLDAIRKESTLVILDEVHHLYKQGLWASRTADILGNIETGLRAYVLNLSGTLFRTKPGERIATVAYTPTTNDAGEPRLEALTDYTIESQTLVKEGLLRRPNLWRIGAEVDLVDLQEGTIRTTSIADITNTQEQSHAVRGFHKDPHCRETFVSIVLNKLQQMERDSGHEPVKALIVAMDIRHAQLYTEEINQQMQRRHLQPLAVCVTSDDPKAHDALERFRGQRRVGVLCTVQMVGEGYDCPEICVIGYASNIITEMFIRQVIARGQRVTKWERERLKRPLSVQVIVPDFPEIVDHFKAVLMPMVLDLPAEEPPPPPPPPPSPGERTQCPVCSTWHSPHRLCPTCYPPIDRVSDIRDPNMDAVTTVAEEHDPALHDHDPAWINLLSDALESVQVPGSDAPAIATALKKVDVRRPFDEPITPPAAAPRPPARTRPLSPREEADRYRERFNKGVRWVIAKNPGSTQEWKAHFVQSAKMAGGITQLDLATADQLLQSLRALGQWIRAYCAEHQLEPPRDFFAGWS